MIIFSGSYTVYHKRKKTGEQNGRMELSGMKNKRKKKLELREINVYVGFCNYCYQGRTGKLFSISSSSRFIWSK
jgi:hypothetical protein